jgi:hypothetical protein
MALKFLQVSSGAQFAETFLRITAAGVSLVAIAYAVSALDHVLGPAFADHLKMVKGVIAIAAVVLVLPALLRMIWLRAQFGGECADGDSYIGEVFRKACVVAFQANFVTLTIASGVIPKMPATLAPVFFVEVILAFTLGVFGATFFATLWQDRVEFDEADE